MNNTAPVQEFFISTQGEGQSVGTIQTFVRTASCNFWEEGHPCKWKSYPEGNVSVCDTEYAGLASSGTEMSVDEVIEKIESLGVRHIFLTGGEPLVYPSFVQELAIGLHYLYYDIEVQTNGSKQIWKSPFIKWSMDLKMPSSGNSVFNMLQNLKVLGKKDQVKCVIADRADYDYAVDILCKRNLKCQIFLQPAWRILDPKDLVAWMIEDKLDHRLSLQTQKYIWGEKVRGV